MTWNNDRNDWPVGESPWPVDPYDNVLIPLVLCL